MTSCLAPLTSDVCERTPMQHPSCRTPMQVPYGYLKYIFNTTLRDAFPPRPSVHTPAPSRVYPLKLYKENGVFRTLTGGFFNTPSTRGGCRWTAMTPGVAPRGERSVHATMDTRPTALSESADGDGLGENTCQRQTHEFEERSRRIESSAGSAPTRTSPHSAAVRFGSEPTPARGVGTTGPTSSRLTSHWTDGL